MTEYKCKVITKPSNHRGRGVYATCAIKKGEVVTHYPVDATHKTSKLSNGNTGIYGVDVKWKFKGDTTFLPDERYYICDEKRKYVYAPDPERFDPEFCGHIMNDFISIPKKFIQFKPVSKNELGTGYEYADHAIYPPAIHQYNKISYFFRNVERTRFTHVGKDRRLGFAMVATRDIKKDEELYFHYGYNYWFGQRIREYERDHFIDNKEN